MSADVSSEKCYKKKDLETEKYPLTNQWITEERAKNIFKVLESNENEPTTLSEPSGYRNERGKFTDLSVSGKGKRKKKGKENADFK